MSTAAERARSLLDDEQWWLNSGDPVRGWLEHLTLDELAELAVKVTADREVSEDARQRFLDRIRAVAGMA